MCKRKSRNRKFVDFDFYTHHLYIYTSGFAASLRPAFDCQRFYILAASPRRMAGLRPDCQRFYILAASPRSAAGLRPDFQRFYILAASPRRSAGLRPDYQRFMGGGFRCRSKIQILLDPRYSRAGRPAFGRIFKDFIY